MLAAIYIRVSTEDQVQHGYSLAEQKSACTKRAKELQADEIKVFADEGVSGAVLYRPGLEALREAVQSGQVDCIIVRDPDRLSRKLAHQLLLTEEFEKAGVKLEFLDFDWKDTPEGRLFYSIKGAVAEYEREKIKERMVRGKFQKAQQGGIPTGFYVYGYTYEKETGQVSINKDEADVVKKIYNWYVSEDIGISGVAARLNDMGVPTRKRRGFWHRQVVRQILVNPVYKGEWKYGKFDWSNNKPRQPENVVTIRVPAIVDPAVWEQAQEKIAEGRRLRVKKGKRNYLLSGILTCSDCGNPMVGAYIRSWGKSDRRYTCRRSRSVSRNTGCKSPKAILADVLENLVWEQIKTYLFHPDLIAREAASNVKDTGDLEQELERVENHIKEVDKGREAVLDALASGLLELDGKTKKKLDELKHRKEKLEQRKKELEANLRARSNAVARLENFKNLAVYVLEHIDGLSFEEKRAVVRSMVSQILVSGRPTPGHPARSMDGVSVTITLKIPDLSSSLSLQK